MRVDQEMPAAWPTHCHWRAPSVHTTWSRTRNLVTEPAHHVVQRGIFRVQLQRSQRVLLVPMCIPQANLSAGEVAHGRQNDREPDHSAGGTVRPRVI